MTSRKKQADYAMVGAFGLLLICSAITIWLHSRYQQAASAVEAALAKGIIVENGKFVSAAAGPQVIADARLRSFLIMSTLTALSAGILIIIVVWHRKQRLSEAHLATESDQQEPANG